MPTKGIKKNYRLSVISVKQSLGEMPDQIWCTEVKPLLIRNRNNSLCGSNGTQFFLKFFILRNLLKKRSQIIIGTDERFSEVIDEISFTEPIAPA